MSRRAAKAEMLGDDRTSSASIRFSLNIICFYCVMTATDLDWIAD